MSHFQKTFSSLASLRVMAFAALSVSPLLVNAVHAQSVPLADTDEGTGTSPDAPQTEVKKVQTPGLFSDQPQDQVIKFKQDGRPLTTTINLKHKDDPNRRFNFENTGELKAQEVRQEVLGDRSSIPSQQVEKSDGNTTTTKILVNSGYPLFSLSGGYDVGSSGLSQTLLASSTQFNLSGPSFLEFRAQAQLDFTPSIFMDAKFGFRQLSTANSALGTFALQSSTANIDNFNIAGHYCYNFSNFRNRVCLGEGLGSESFPILAFVTNTTLSATTLNDLVLTSSLAGDFQVTPVLDSHLEVDFDWGLQSGQSGIDRLTKDYKYGVAVLFSYKPAMLAAYNIALQPGFGLERRYGAFSRGGDSWTSINTSYAAQIGLKYTFGGG